MPTGVSASEVNELERLVEREPHFTDLLDAFEKAEPEHLTRLVSVLHTGMRESRKEAARDAARAVIESKLTGELIHTLEKLDRSAKGLQKTAIWVMVLMGLATIAVTVL